MFRLARGRGVVLLHKVENEPSENEFADRHNPVVGLAQHHLKFAWRSPVIHQPTAIMAL